MVAFSSVGDIISVSLLVKDLLLAIDSSRGAAAEYQEVVRELYVLDTALLEVERLARTHEGTPEVHALCEIAQRSVDKSRICVDTFTKRIKKFGGSLAEGGKGNVFKHAARSVQWQLGREDVDRFRAEIMSHSNAIHMMITTAQVTLLNVGNQDLAKRITNSQASLGQQNAVLAEIRDKIEENKRLIADGNTMSVTMLQRFQWLKQLGSDIKGFMMSIMQSNFAIYREVVSIRKRLATAPGWSLAEEPFLLEDAIGRIAPVHLRFITSWRAFDAVIEARFEGRKSYTKVKRRDYVLQDNGTTQEVDRAMDWDIAFMPGQRINMSLIFRRQEAAATEQPSDSTMCPHCHARSAQAPDTDVQCSSCRRWFRRIVELCDDEPEPAFATPQGRSDTPVFGKTSFNVLPIRPKAAGKRPAPEDSDDDDDDDDMTGVMRVRLIARQKRRRLARTFGDQVVQGSFGAVETSTTEADAAAQVWTDWAKQFPKEGVPTAPVLAPDTDTTPWRDAQHRDDADDHVSVRDGGGFTGRNRSSSIDERTHKSTIDKHTLVQVPSSGTPHRDTGHLRNAPVIPKTDCENAEGIYAKETCTAADDKIMSEGLACGSATGPLSDLSGNLKDGPEISVVLGPGVNSQPKSKIDADPAGKPTRTDEERGGDPNAAPIWSEPRGYCHSPLPSSYVCKTSPPAVTTAGQRYYSPRSHYWYGKSASRASDKDIPKYKYSSTYDPKSCYGPYSDNYTPAHDFKYTYGAYTPSLSRKLSSRRPIPKLSLPAVAKATEEDARKAGIPLGYQLKNWDPTEQPILLLGSAFDADSLGKWIYDWSVYYFGSGTPMSEVTGDLWLLLIQLAGKIKRAEEVLPRIRQTSGRDMVDDFIESGERLWQRFTKLLKLCEKAMWKIHKAEREKKKDYYASADGTLGKQASAATGVAFVETMFGKDRELERTEKMMTGMRLWSMRFDANCEEILRDPAGWRDYDHDSLETQESVPDNAAKRSMPASQEASGDGMDVEGHLASEAGTRPEVESQHAAAEAMDVDEGLPTGPTGEERKRDQEQIDQDLEADTPLIETSPSMSNMGTWGHNWGSERDLWGFGTAEKKNKKGKGKNYDAGAGPAWDEEDVWASFGGGKKKKKKKTKNGKKQSDSKDTAATSEPVTGSAVVEFQTGPPLDVETKEAEARATQSGDHEPDGDRPNTILEVVSSSKSDERLGATAPPADAMAAGRGIAASAECSPEPSGHSDPKRGAEDLRLPAKVTDHKDQEQTSRPLTEPPVAAASTDGTDEAHNATPTPATAAAVHQIQPCPTVDEPVREPAISRSPLGIDSGAREERAQAASIDALSPGPRQADHAGAKRKHAADELSQLEPKKPRMEVEEAAKLKHRSPMSAAIMKSSKRVTRSWDKWAKSA